MSLVSSILEAKDIAEEIVNVTAWEAAIGLRGMTARQRADFAKVAATDPAKATVRALIDCAFDPGAPDKPLFEQAHQDALLKKSGKVVDDLVKVIIRLSGFDIESEKELEKNS